MSLKKNPISFLIGTDPELLLMKGRKTLPARRYCFNNDDELGSDGNGVTWELRPEPDKNPLVVVNRMRDIMVRKITTKNILWDGEWHSGSYTNGFPLGGHIHFGIKENIIKPSILADILDNYLGAITLLIENKQQGYRRRSAGYGFMGDYRKPPHGLEYRTPSSYLTSPYVFSAILCLAKTIAFEAINNRQFSFNSYVHGYDFTYMQTETILKNFPLIWDDITKMILYQKYKLYIDVIYFLVTNKLSWFPTSSFKQSWGLVKFDNWSQNKMKLNTIWARYTQSLGEIQTRKTRNT